MSNTDNIISINNSSLIKKKRKLCPHNRQRSQCKECRGASICEHNRRKSTCKECKVQSSYLYDNGIDMLLKAASQL